MPAFVIHSVSKSAPADLRAGVPLTATTLARLHDAEGHTDFWCARLDGPVKYRFGREFSRAGCRPEFLSADEQGEFLWVPVVAVWSRTAQKTNSFHSRGISCPTSSA
jgi:hypothetical protein